MKIGQDYSHTSFHSRNLNYWILFYCPCGSWRQIEGLEFASSGVSCVEGEVRGVGGREREREGEEKEQIFKTC